MTTSNLLSLFRCSLFRSNSFAASASSINYKKSAIISLQERFKSTSTAVNNDTQESTHIVEDTTEEQGAAKVNYFKNTNPIPYKPDGEYPDWLWTLLDEPIEGSKTFVRRERKKRSRELNTIRKQRKF